MSCNGFACNGTGCYTSCSGDGQCAGDAVLQHGHRPVPGDRPAGPLVLGGRAVRVEPLLREYVRRRDDRRELRQLRQQVRDRRQLLGGSCTCPAGQMACSGTCVATQTSTSNCGTCGNACLPNGVCVGGGCQCPNGTLDCGGVCATCATPPSGAVSSCSGATCSFTCTASGTVACGNACSNFQTDGLNCGSCGHNCQGGGCTGGVCQAITVGTFTAAAQGGFAIDTTTAYAAIPGSSSGVVEKCALAGCTGSGPGLVASSQPPTMYDIAATSGGVFWAAIDNSGAGYVSGCVPSTNSTVTSYGTWPSMQPTSVAATSTNVYWVLSSGIMACPVAGCPGGTAAGATVIESGGSPEFLTLGTGFVYYTTGFKPTTLMKCALGGCGSSPTSLGTSSASDDWYYPSSDSTNVYLTGVLSGSMYACSQGGCAGGATTLGPAGGSYVASDSTNVYWLSSNALVKCAVGGCGGSPTTVLPGRTPSNTSGPNVRVDGTFIYWLEGATLYKVAK